MPSPRLRLAVLPLLALLPLLSPAFAVAQSDCDGLEILGLWIDPWDPQVARLLVANSSPEIFDYPQWNLVDAQGTPLGTHETVLFGLSSISDHTFALESPWSGTEDVPVDLSLWTGFGTEPACDFATVLTPRTFAWTGGAAGDCLPVRLSVQGLAPAGEEAVWTATWRDHNTGEVLASEALALTLSAGYQAVSGVFCIDQTRCHQLTLTASSGDLVGWLQLIDSVHPELWHRAETLNAGAEWSVVWDLYGGDCGPVAVPDPPHASASAAPTERWIHSLSGALLHHERLPALSDPPSLLTAPDGVALPPGLYLVTTCSPAGCTTLRRAVLPGIH